MRLHLQRLQGPGPRRCATCIHDDGFDIAVVDILFLIRKLLEFLERTIGFKFVEIEAKLNHSVAECVTPAVLAQNKARLA